MRINFQHAPQSAAEVSSKQKTADSKSSPAAGKTASDRVDVSGSHVDFKALEARASGGADIRGERVESLRAAIAGGQYQPGPEQVARALFSHMVDVRQRS